MWEKESRAGQAPRGARHPAPLKHFHTTLLVFALVLVARGSLAWQFVNRTWLLSSGGGAFSRDGVEDGTGWESVRAKGASMGALASIDFFPGVDLRKPVIVTCFTAPLLELYHNFACHLDALGMMAQHIVYALDDLTFDTLRAEGIPAMHAAKANIQVPPSQTPLSEDQEYVHGTTDFARMSYYKLRVLEHASRALSEYGFLYSDVDVVFLENPLDHVNTTLDMQFASDYRIAPAAEISRVGSSHNHLGYLCTGIFFGRGEVASDVLRAAVEFGERPFNTGRDDQLAVNAVLADTDLLPRRARIGTFDGLSFSNGYTFFHRHVPQRLSIEPVAVHANYIIGKDAKRQQMMLHGLWKWMKKSRKCHPGATSELSKSRQRQQFGTHTDDAAMRAPTHPNGDEKDTWLTLTCAEDEEMLANFHYHISKHINTTSSAHLCSFQVSETEDTNWVRLSEKFSISCGTDYQAAETKGFSWVRSLIQRLEGINSQQLSVLGKHMLCRKVQVLVLDYVIQNENLNVDGVLWADSGTVFVSDPLSNVAQQLKDKHLDIAASSGWTPRPVLGTLQQQSPLSSRRLQSLREARLVAHSLRDFDLPPPRIDTDVLYMKVNRRTRAIFARAQPFIHDIFSMGAILDAELGGGNCFGDELPLTPGLNISRLIFTCKAVEKPEQIYWGALDPLLFVDARNHQLAVDIAAPVRAVRFLPPLPGHTDIRISQIGHMLAANMWQPSMEKDILDWSYQWHLFQETISLSQARQREADVLMNEGGTLKSQLENSGKWDTFEHACVVSRQISEAMVPLTILLQQASKVNRRMVHFIGGGSPKRGCKDDGRPLEHQSRCTVVRRFLTNRVADHQFMFHGSGVEHDAKSAGAAEPSDSELERLIRITAVRYPFIKCEITVVVREEANGRIRQIFQKMLKSGLATLDGKLIAVKTPTHEGK